jgi:hypothetical protein
MKYEITIEADSNSGILEALWQIYEAFRRNETPLGGKCPASMGVPYEYACKPVLSTTLVTVVCDRCDKIIEGIRTPHFTGGFYEISYDLPNLKASSWRPYVNAGEHIVCDACMHSDPRYIAVYGTHAMSATPMMETAASPMSGKTEDSACA